jgi:peptide/nickel transport system ATP-binding protein
MTFLEVRNLSIQAGATSVVLDASLRLEASQTYTLLGETGSGKSLLAQAVMGSLPAGLRSSGTITVFGETSEADEPAQRRRLWGHSLALLPQEPWLALDPTMRVLSQVTETYQKVSRAPDGVEGARSRAAADFRSLGLAGAERKLPGALSGGMAQRTAFAAVRAGGARLLIVDEPTKGLDAGLRDSVVAMLKQVAGSGGAVLTITHDIAAARLLGGTIGVMLEGEIVEQGPADQVLAKPRHDYTRRLLAADPQAWAPRTQPSPGGPVLTAAGLSKRFGKQQLFENLDIEVAHGERVAVIGPSGSGKTTLGGMLLGLVPPDSGSVSRQTDVPVWKYQKLYQDPIAAFAPRVTLRTSLRDLVSRHGLQWADVEKWMERTRLRASLLDRLPDQVSSGELQRIALVRVLLLKPVLLVADEPTSRLDPITQQETIDLLVEHLAESACSLVLITHDPAIARNVTSRVVALSRPDPFTA